MPGNVTLRRRLAAQHHDLSVVLRRAGVAQPAQQMRISSDTGREQRSDGAAAGRAAIVITAAVDADIQRGDRLTYDGTVYEVQFVRPRRDAETVADAEAVQ